MTISKEAERLISLKKKTMDQAILDPNIFVKDFPLDPWTPYLKTNNFVQQTISRILGYSETEQKWVRIKIDDEGRLITTGEVEAPGAVTLEGRKYKEWTIADGVDLAAGGTLTHTGIDVNDYSGVSILVSSTGNSTVYVQISDDNMNWYDVKSPADSDRAWNCNNEKIAIPLNLYAHYMRVVIYASTASTVTVKVIAQV